MGVTPEEFVNELLSKPAVEQPSDEVNPEESDIELPEWFDEKKYNTGRRFFNDFCFSFTGSMLLGLVAVFSVPSIIKILIGTRRSNSIFTAYKRYLSTLLHTMTWFEHELKPGSLSWRSLSTVRSRHFRAGQAAKAKGLGVVSQRDIALTQFGFVGFSMLKPEAFSIRQFNEGDWEAYNHVWRVIGYMIGLEDKYNICRETVEETREVCQLLLDRVYTPCLENAPEYFEHMARVMLDGMWSVNPTIEVDANIYWTRYLANVPGYVYTENDRIKLQRRLKKQFSGKNLDFGVETTSLMEKTPMEGLPELPPRLLYYNDYNTLETVPTYKRLTFKSKCKLFLNQLYMLLYTTYLGRLYFNLNFKFSVFLMRYFPFIAFFRFGVKVSFVNLFEEAPKDDTKVKVNAEYYKMPKQNAWYEWVSAILW